MKTPMKTTLSVLALAISAATAVNATSLTHDNDAPVGENQKKSDVNYTTRYYPRLEQDNHGHQKPDVNDQKFDVSDITRYHPRLKQSNQKSDVNEQKSDVSDIIRYHPRLK